MTVPCVIARPLDVAERLLHEAGIGTIEVQQTQPPRGALSGVQRVVRQRAIPTGVELVTAASARLADRETSHD